ncbi:MAG: hypothetical protein ACLQVM_01685 [Terriglobia bacterium]
MIPIICSWLTKICVWFTPDKVIAFATIVYAGVTVVMFFAIRSQARAAHRQADIARDAANAAKQSADALVNSERAWIFGTVEDFPGDGKISPTDKLEGVRVVCNLMNYGKTPGCIIEIGVNSDQPQDLEDTKARQPDYGQIESVYVWVAAGKAVRRVLELSTTDFIAINRQDRSLVIRGSFKYLDVFSNPPHITRFCFGYRAIDPVGFYRYGGAKENEQT